MTRLIFITGTDTGIGKTFLTVLLAQYLRRKNQTVAALKPFCSGGRDDAEALHAALGGTLSLDEINPWHFRNPVAPLLAAREEKLRINLNQTVKYIREVRKRFAITLVEGAGGLLSPLGVGFDSRDLIHALRATPIIVGSNRLGVINQVRLTLDALAKSSAAQAQIVLMSPRVPDSSTETNVKLLGEFVSQKRIHLLPWITSKRPFTAPAVCKSIERLLRNISLP
ncbi:MAG TPA: dethiobiotin synthase [Verrucomicrobiae bacterium]|nr:dethiobiotin synthase [Verrucomicrobiae bacterium]